MDRPDEWNSWRRPMYGRLWTWTVKVKAYLGTYVDDLIVVGPTEEVRSVLRMRWKPSGSVRAAKYLRKKDRS